MDKPTLLGPKTVPKPKSTSSSTGSTSRVYSFESFVIVGVAVCVSAASAGVHCYSYDRCKYDNSCIGTNSNGTAFLPKCSFRTILPLTSNIYYENASSVENLAALTRGYCGFGERLQLRDGVVRCGVHYTYPEALNREIMDPLATSDSFKACGKWLGTGVSLASNSAEYYSFDGIATRQDAIRRSASAADANALLAHSNIGKFRAMCHRTVLAGSGALKASGKLVYDHLISQMPHVNDIDSALTAMGILVGHYCDGPVRIGWDYASKSESRAFLTTFSEGVVFAPDAMSQALELVDVSGAEIIAAEQANNQVNVRAFTSLELPSDAIERVFGGATNIFQHADFTRRVDATWQLDGFYELATIDVAAARSYLHGVAAVCSFSLQNTIDSVGYTTRGKAGEDLAKRRVQNPKAVALGRLTGTSNLDNMEDEVDSNTMLNATTATLSQLVSAPFADAETSCLSFARAIFPDDMDEQEFELVVTPLLYTRIQGLVEQVRTGVMSVLSNNAIVRGTLADPDSVAADVENVRVRIPGAPRGSWAGSTRSVPVSNFESSDGIFVMAAKQARAVFLDRQSKMISDATDICEGPAVYDSLSTNAYIFASRRCAFYLLGMSFRPFADEQFTDESLASRLGYVIAHEMAHSTLNTDFVEDNYANLLTRYTDASTHSEAIADVIGALGVLHTGLVNSSDLCMHVAQLWCARVPPLYYTETSTHPMANIRGNALCQTMRDLRV